MSLMTPNVAPFFENSAVSALSAPATQIPVLTRAFTLTLFVPPANTYISTLKTFSAAVPGTSTLYSPTTETPVLTHAFSLTTV